MNIKRLLTENGMQNWRKGY